MRGLNCFIRQDGGYTQPETKDEIVQAIGSLLAKLEQKQLRPEDAQVTKEMQETLKRFGVSSADQNALPAAPGPDAAAASTATSGEKKLQKVVGAAMAAQEMSLQPGSLAPALNELISILWPRIGNFVEDLIRNTIEPQINASLPGLAVKAGGVQFTTVSLGKSSPLLGPIVVEQDKDNGAITMRIGTDITCDLDVELKAVGIPIGIDKFVLKGDLAVLMTPPMDKPPFFGGLEIYFTNPPDIDIHFAGAAKVAQIPGLRGSIRGAIDGAVAGVCVLPRRIAVDIDEEDESDSIDWVYPDPINILRITLWSGTNLVAADSHMFGAATSDPYVVATMGVKTWRSPTVNKNLNPVWGDGQGVSTDLPLHDGAQVVTLKVFDEDFLQSDDLIGMSARLQARELAQNGEPQTVELLKANGEAGGGSLSITARLLSLVPTRPGKPIAPAGPSEAHLSAKLLNIKGLPTGAAYPFKVSVQVVRPADGSAKAKDVVLAEEFTQPSHPMVQKQLAAAFQDIAKHLSKKGKGNEEIAEILEVSIPEVQSFLQTCDESDDAAKAKQVKARQKDELERLNVKKPFFDEVVDVLLPCDSVQDLSVLVLTILDKKQKTIATARMPMSKLIAAENLTIDGIKVPFATDVPEIRLFGSLRLLWLDVPGMKCGAK